MIKNYFDFARGVKYSTSTCTQQIFENVIDSTEVAEIIDQITEIEKDWRADMTQDELCTLKGKVAPLKKQLPVILPHAHFTDGHRHQLSAVQSAFCSADFDGLEAPIVTWHEKFRPQLNDLRVALAYVSPSGHGLKVIFVRVEGMTNEQNQLWISKMVGIDNYDSTADLARAAFLTKRSNLLHYDPSLLFAQEVELTPSCDRYEAMVSGAKAAKSITPKTEKNDSADAPTVSVTLPAVIPTYKGIQLTAIRDALLTRWGIGAEGPKVGERNNIVFKLAHELASLDSSYDVLAHVIPNYTMDEKEWSDTLRQAIKYSSHGKPSRELIDIIDELQTDDDVQTAPTVDLQKTLKVPSNIPGFFKVVLRKYPKYQHPAVLAAMMPICATLATKARVKASDGITHALSAQACVVGEWGSGKDCISILYERLMYKIREEDDKNRAIEEEWVENRESSADNVTKPHRPHNPIRMLTSSTTKIKMLERMKDAKGQHCILFTSEIEEIANNASLSYSKIEPILRLAYDRDGGWVGNDSCSTQSANMNIKARINVLFAGTDNAVHKFYKSPEGGGTSRVIFAIMPDRLGMEKPKYKDYTEEEDAEINRYIDLLMAEDNEKEPYVLSKVERQLLAWQNQFRSEYNNKQVDKAKLKLTYRAYEIALRAATVAYIVNGKKEDEKVVNFARYIANLVVFGGYALFADKMNEESTNVQRRETNMRIYATPVKDLLNRLPEEFTKQDLIQLRTEQGAEHPDNVRSILSRWRINKFIEDMESEKGKFRKLKNA